jgi:hypothetical protein
VTFPVTRRPRKALEALPAPVSAIYQSLFVLAQEPVNDRLDFLRLVQLRFGRFYKLDCIIPDGAFKPIRVARCFCIVTIHAVHSNNDRQPLQRGTTRSLSE